MTIPAFAHNVEIVRIERPIRGFGGAAVSRTALLRNLKASRQPTTLTVFDAPGDREELMDSEFYVDIPEAPFDVRLGDLITWRRLDPDSGVPTGKEQVDAEIRRIDVNDVGLTMGLAHVMFLTRGAHGEGS